QAVPRRGLPGGRRAQARAPRDRGTRRALRRDHRRRRDHPGAGLLSRQLRGGSEHHGRWRAGRPRRLRRFRRRGRGVACAMTRVFVPRDATALSLGAERVARALAETAAAAGAPLEIVRTGSRGLFWLEPMVEVETAAGRIAYGPVAPAVVPGLLPALRDGGAHAL